MADRAPNKYGSSRNGRPLWIMLACVLVTLSLAACTIASTPPEAESQDVASETTQEVHLDMTGFANRAAGFASNTVISCGNAWFASYVNSRIIPVSEPTRADVSVPLHLGPWTAEADYGATDARFDGSITQWNDDYYITHDWSEYGQQILALWPGDTVTINGRTVTVQGICNYPKDSYLDEIRTLAGTNTMVLQTCLPDSDLNRIVYGA